MLFLSRLAFARFAVVAFIVGWLGFASLSGAAPDAPVSWRAAMGTDKQFTENDRHLGTVRGWPSQSAAGFTAEVTAEHPADVPVVTGKFSGRPRQYDFEGKYERSERRQVRTNIGPANRGADFKFGPAGAVRAIDEDDRAGEGGKREVLARRFRTPNLLGSLREAEAMGVDIIWNTGQVGPAQPDKIAHLMEDRGEALKDQLYELVKTIHTGEFAARKNQVFLEIGNEVNAPDRFSVRDHGDDFANPANADDYVEYYLAPAVEAIRAASRDVFGDERRVKIVCGNVSGILKSRSRAFLDRLLETTIRGEHAPTLAGRKAWEVVDIIAVHYTAGEASVLEPLQQKWVASGRVQSLWSTEELGWRGLGDYSVALTAFRWLNFHARNASPIMARLQFWGDQTAHQGTSTRGADMQRQLGGFFRDFPLQSLDEPRDLALRTGADFEWHALKAAAPAGETRIGVLFYPYPTGQAALGWIKLKLPEVSAGELVSCEAFLLPREKGAEPMAVSTKQSADGLMVQFDNWEVRPTELVLLQVIVRVKKGP